jgi:hypothetical protein
MATLLGVAAVSGCGAHMSSTIHSESVHMAVTDSSGVFSVRVDAGDVHLVAGPSERVSLKGTVTYRGGRPPSILWEHAGNKISLRSICHSRHGDCGYNYTILVPASMTVLADDTAGDIWAKGLAGSLGLNTTAGNVTLGFTSAPIHLVVKASIGNVGVTVPASFSYHMSTSDQLGDVSSGLADDPSSPRAISLSVGTGNISSINPVVEAPSEPAREGLHR